MIPKWLEIAKMHEDMGVKEIPGAKDHPVIVDALRAANYPERLIHDEVPWCAAIVCLWLEMAGLKSTDSAAAASYLNWGKNIEYGRPGCIVMIPRNGGSGYHVGLYDREDNLGVWVLGGNQGDKVCTKRFGWNSVEEFRWPTVREGYSELPESTEAPKPEIAESIPPSEAPIAPEVREAVAESGFVMNLIKALARIFGIGI